VLYGCQGRIRFTENGEQGVSVSFIGSRMSHRPPSVLARRRRPHDGPSTEVTLTREEGCGLRPSQSAGEFYFEELGRSWRMKRAPSLSDGALQDLQRLIH
jgi:hypothetical protein